MNLEERKESICESLEEIKKKKGMMQLHYNLKNKRNNRLSQQPRPE